jgi:alkylation response protein AidB-like acyl-CoA dehydrogenase
MHLDDTPAEAKFRAGARAWLVENARLREDGEDLAWFRALPDEVKLDRARAWQRRKAMAGYAAITLPRDLGGGGGTAGEHIIFRQEESRFATPFGVFEIGLGMCLPTIFALGSDALKQRFIPSGIRGDDIWCQLFSEPEAGSDLAALRTAARRDGEGWRVTGQKIWTTGAHFSDLGLLLARTEPGSSRHDGLTMFIVDMKAVGVVVRPIRQISGEADYNEVFFDDVWIPDAHRLTDVGCGWSGAVTTLMFERMNVGADIGLIDWRAGLRQAVRLGVQEDSVLREKIVDWYLDAQGVNLFAYRTLTALGQGRPPGPEQSIAKLIMARQAQDIAETLLAHAGAAGALAEDEHPEDMRPVLRSWLWGAGMRVAGGTDEILRNVIADRVLSLPR